MKIDFNIHDMTFSTIYAIVECTLYQGYVISRFHCRKNNYTEGVGRGARGAEDKEGYWIPYSL